MKHKTKTSNSDRRQIFCGLIALVAFFDVIGLVGAVEVGDMTLGECIPRVVVALIVMAAAVIFSENTEERA